MTRTSPLMYLFLIVMAWNVRAKTDPQEGEKDSKKAVLVLEGSFFITSDPLLRTVGTAKSTSSREALVEIFGTESIRDLLISGGGDQRLSHETMSPKNLQAWKDKCDEIPDAHIPVATGRAKNEAMLVTEVDVRFPGLTLVTKSLTGVQLLVDARTGLPWYEYCLLAQKQVPSGMSLAVKMFNQITGEGNRTEDESLHPVSGASLSKVSLIETTTAETGGALAIRYDCWVRLEFSFPAILMRLVPISKSRLEKIISSGIVKKAKKEVRKGLEAAREVMLTDITGDSMSQRSHQQSEL